MIAPLQFEGGGRDRPVEGQRPLQAKVVADLPADVDRDRPGRAGREEPVFEGGEKQSQGAELEEDLQLGEVGVADDHVEAPVLGGVAVGLVAGVDDRPLERGFETNLFLEEVGPLGQLEADLGPAVLRPDLARPGEDLAGDEESGGEPDHVTERGLPGKQVVLVGAVAVALAVGVVLVDRDPLTGREQFVRGVGRPCMTISPTLS